MCIRRTTQPISIREIEAIPESVKRQRFEVGDRVVVPNDLFCIRSRGSGEFWVGLPTVKRCIDDMCFLTTGTGGHVMLPINQRELRGYTPSSN